MKKMSAAFLLRPLEPGYFGKPVSFSAGESHYGQSEFPPGPMTFQGIVRSHLLHCVTSPRLDLDDWSKSARDERERLVGGPDHLPDGWQLKGPYPACETAVEDRTGDGEFPEMFVAPWVSAPRFLMKSNRGPCPLHARPVMSSHPGLNDMASERNGPEAPMLLGRPEAGATESLAGWIGPENLYFALAGEGNASWNEDQFSGDYRSLPPFVFEEFQPGVAIDPKTGSSKFGMLYALESLRFKTGSGLAGWFSGNVDDRIPTAALEKGSAGIGRKRRIAAFEKLDRCHPAWEKTMNGEHIPSQIEEDTFFWVTTLTPVRLANPCKPDIRVASLPEVKIVVRGALIGHPVTIGGYRMATGTNRPNRQYVPPGSSWLIQIAGGDDETRGRALKMLNNSHAFGPAEEAGFGFGHIVVGIGPDSRKGETP